MPYFIKEKNIQLSADHKVYTEREMYSRYDVLLQSYCKVINIEAKTMLDMAQKDILPAVSKYSQVLGNTILAKRAVSNALDVSYETEILTEISTLTASAYEAVKVLETAVNNCKTITDVAKKSMYCKNEILTTMQKLRADIDKLEMLVSAEYWPMPTYGDLLFGV